MHILIVTDQHPDSLGGAQVAIRAQRDALMQLGHTVTIAAPAMHLSVAERQKRTTTDCIELPSRPVTRDREYSMSWPSAKSVDVIRSQLAGKPPVDIVHIQGDFWGALIGLRVARELSKPVVLTLHNNVHQGTSALTRLAPLVFALLRLWRQLVLGKPRGRVDRRARGAWRYLAQLASEAEVVIAPSKHFAQTLIDEHVSQAPRVVRGGVNDELVASIRSRQRSERSRPKLVWLGRMSAEKRILEFIDAIAEARLDADVVLFGGGLLAGEVRRRIEQHQLAGTVRMAGNVTHEEALSALHDADALIQTSIDFETQGLTPFEAASLGTPTVFCDRRIAQDAQLSIEWIVPSPNVHSLASTLSDVVEQLATSSKPMRIPFDEARGFLQSVQTEHLVEIYREVAAASTQGDTLI